MFEEGKFYMWNTLKCQFYSTTGDDKVGIFHGWCDNCRKYHKILYVPYSEITPLDETDSFGG